MRITRSFRHQLGPMAVVAALGFVAVGVVYPQMSTADAAYATESANVGPIQKQLSIEVEDMYDGIPISESDHPGEIEVVVYNTSGEGKLPAMKRETISIVVQEYLQITIPDGQDGRVDVTMTADPSSANTTTTNSADFTVAGNSQAGFDVFVYAADDDQLNLTGENGSDDTITPITGSGIALASFGSNTWGYNVGTNSTTDSYRPLTTQAETTAAYTNNGPSAGTNLKLNCGAKVSSGIATDRYSTDVVISAVSPASNWAP